MLLSKEVSTKRFLAFINSLLVMFSVIIFPVFAVGQIQFQKTYESVGNSQVLDGCQLEDSGYVFTGFSTDMGLGSQDVFLLKTDQYGNQQWVKHYGGVGIDQGHGICQTADKGILITGYTSSFGVAFNDLYLIKTDSLGNLEWSKTIGGPSTDRGYSVATHNNGMSFVVGSSYSFGAGNADILVVKLDNGGNIIWRKTFGGIGFEEGYEVKITEDSGCIILGTTYSFGAGSEDFYLLKLDANGTVEWSSTFGGDDWDQGRSLCLTSDGGYALAGFTQSFDMQKHYDLKYFVVKVDSLGGFVWSRTFGLPNSESVPSSIIESNDKGLVVVGYSGDFVGDYRGYLVKLDELGNLLWSRLLGNGYLNNCNAVFESMDGGLVMGGYSNGFNDGNTAGYVIKSNNYGESGCFDTLVASLIKDTIPAVLPPLDSITEIFVVDTVPTLVIDSPFVISAICENSCQLMASFLYEPTPNTGGDSVLCIGSSVFLSNTTLGADTFYWEINGEITTSVNDTTLFFDTVGTYTVTLIVDSSFCQDAKTIQIEVVDLAVAGFGWSVNNLTVSFLDSSTIASSYSWDFGDGTTDSIPNPVHTFADTGSYTICLTIENGCGSDVICQTLDIDCLFPIAGYNYLDTGLIVDFMATSQYADTYYWVFDDGVTSTEQNPVHTFPSPGVYDVCLINSNACGADAYCVEIVVDSIVDPPVGMNSINSEMLWTYSNQSGTLEIWCHDVGEGPFKLFIYNLVGEQLLSLIPQKVNHQHLKANIPIEQPGIYIAILLANNEARVKKISIF